MTEDIDVRTSTYKDINTKAPTSKEQSSQSPELEAEIKEAKEKVKSSKKKVANKTRFVKNTEVKLKKVQAKDNIPDVFKQFEAPKHVETAVAIDSIITANPKDLDLITLGETAMQLRAIELDEDMGGSNDDLRKEAEELRIKVTKIFMTKLVDQVSVGKEEERKEFEAVAKDHEKGLAVDYTPAQVRQMVSKKEKARKGGYGERGLQAEAKAISAQEWKRRLEELDIDKNDPDMVRLVTAINQAIVAIGIGNIDPDDAKELIRAIRSAFPIDAVGTPLETYVGQLGNAVAGNASEGVGIASARANAAAKKEGYRTKEKGFDTFVAEYLSPEERKKIKDIGPEYWESFYDDIVFLLTADPEEQVVRENTLQSKLSALKNYIQSAGAEYFINEENLNPHEAHARADAWLRELSTDMNHVTMAHDILRGILQSQDPEQTKTFYGGITQSLYNKLSGYSITDNPVKQRLVSDANRIYERAAIEVVTKRYRRVRYLKDKFDRGATLSEKEQVEMASSHMLYYEDLVPQLDTWHKMHEHSHDIYIYGFVKSRLVAKGLMDKDSGVILDPRKAEEEIDRISSESIEVSKSVRAEMDKSKVDWDTAISNMKARGKLDEDPVSFSKDDRSVFWNVVEDLENRKISFEAYKHDFTTEEQRLLDTEEGIYSPVEQIVYNDLMQSEEVRLREDLRRVVERKGLSKQEADSWLDARRKIRRSYVRTAIVSARQHMYFTKRLQKINATVGTLPESNDKKLAAPNVEHELRYMNWEVDVFERFGRFGQPLMEDMMSLVKLSQLNNQTIQDLRLSDDPEWLRLAENVLFQKKDDKPHAYGGMQDVNAYLQEELGIPYSMFVQKPLVHIGGLVDATYWREYLSTQAPMEALMGSIGKNTALGSGGRFEHSIGLQFILAGEITDKEVARGAHDYMSLDFLLERMQKEFDMISREHVSGKEKAVTAREYMYDRFGTDNNERIASLDAMRRMRALIADYNVAEGETRVSIGKTIQAMYDKGVDFEHVKKEIAIERKKYMLEQLAFRLPTVTAGYFAKDANDILARAVADSVSRDVFLDKDKLFKTSETLWNATTNALSAVQNDIVRHQVTNDRVDSYFAKESEVTNFDDYLREFLSENDYRQYGDTCHMIVGKIRNYFVDMRKGEVGRAVSARADGLIESGDSMVLGMKQQEMIARYDWDMLLTMEDMPLELREIQNAGGQASMKRRAGEFHQAANAYNVLADIISKFHVQEPAETAKKVDEFIKIYQGWKGPDAANISGQSIVEGWLHEVKASKAMEDWPWFEGVMRWLVRREEGEWFGAGGSMKKAGLSAGSRVTQILGDPNAMNFQKHEIHEVLEVLRSFDAFLQRPEVMRDLAKKFHATNPELARYQMKRILPGILLGVIILFMVGGFRELIKDQEE